MAASLEAGIAQRLGLAIGQHLTIDLMGESHEIEITRFHEADWTRLDLDFPILLAPPAEPPPHRLVAALWLEAGAADLTVIGRVGEAFPDVPMIVVADVLLMLDRIVTAMARVATTVAAGTVVAALLVLAGGIAATFERRLRDLALLRLQGASRHQLAAAIAVELLLLGVAAALPAILLGSVAAWAIASVLSPDLWRLEAAILVTVLLATPAVLAALGYTSGALCRYERLV